MAVNYASADAALQNTDWMRLDCEESLRHQKDDKPEMKVPYKMPDHLRRFLKRYGVALGAAALLGIWTLSVKSIAYNNGYKDAQTILSVEYQEYYDQQIQDYKNSLMAQSLLTGEASLNQQIDADARLLARIGQGVLNTYSTADEDDARKVMLCAVCRVMDNRSFGSIKSIESAVTQPEQWWGYSENLAYTEKIFKIAREISSIYHNGEAMPCSTDMVYAGWNGSEIVLRNQWKADSTARYY